MKRMLAFMPYLGNPLDPYRLLGMSEHRTAVLVVDRKPAPPPKLPEFVATNLPGCFCHRCCTCTTGAVGDRRCTQCRLARCSCPPEIALPTLTPSNRHERRAEAARGRRRRR